MNHGVVNIWRTHFKHGDLSIIGTIHEERTEDGRGLRSTFIVYAQHYKKDIPPIGYSSDWYDDLKSAKRFFKRTHARHTTISWIKVKRKEAGV